MDSKKINQLATNVNPQTSDLTTIGDPITGQLKKITWLQVAHLIGAQAARDLQDVTDDGAVTTNAITTGGLTLSNLGDGVLKTNSSGLVGTYGYGLANGVATLDSGGKIPAAQLPSSVMEYKGTWNASTNTPTLADGTGDNGDVYLVNVAGSQNLGSGTISFAVGDWVVYNGTIWQKSLNSNAVASVFGRTGTITAQEGDYNIDQLGDVTISTASTNDYLRYNGSAWVNTPFPSFVSSDKLVIAVRNNSGATINKGSVVYINGATAGYPTIAKAIATGDPTSAQTMGVVQDNISNNSNGYVIAYGQITGLDTSAYSAGTQLYLSPITAGAFTSTKQYAPNHLVYVGVVTTQNAVNGVIEVRIQNGFEIAELHDVSAQTPSNKDGIFYNSTTDLWENKSIATVLGYTPMPNPMTILGDIIYGGASGAATRLAGNTTTAKQYLSQTGDGTNSAAPAWAAIAGSDITGAALTKSDDTNVTLTLGGNASTSLLRAASLTLGWTGQLSIARGGTGASTAIGGFNALSPLTTLGDILYHDGTNNGRLGGNTTTTKKFLTQTGDGSISAAPIWGTLVAGDIPALPYLSNSTSSTQDGYFGDIYLYDDSTPSHYLQITNSANLTAARLLSINVNDANRTISLSGNLTVSAAATISGTNTGDQTITLTGDVTGSGTGSFATSIGALKVTNSMLAGSIDYAKMDATTVPTWNQNTTGSAATLTTARTLTIGATGKTFNGSANVSWSLAEIGAAASGDLANYLPLIGGTLTGQLILKEGTDSADYTKGLRFPNDPYGGSGDVSGLRLYRSGTTGENQVLELYIGNDGGDDTINFRTGVGGTANNDAVTINGNKIWNSANDGTGSGLDADLLDGQHGTYYAAATSLSNYLPLSGGTLTGILNGTDAVFTKVTVYKNNTYGFMHFNNSTANNQYVVTQHISASDRFLITTGYNGTATNPSLALGTNDTARLIIANNGDTSLTNNFTLLNGSDLIITPATSGVNATLYNDIGKLVSTASLVVQGTGEFDSTISYKGTSLAFEAISGNTGYIYSYYKNTGGQFYLGVERSTTGGLITDSTAYATIFSTTNETNLEFGTNGRRRFWLNASNGAATFSPTGGTALTTNGISGQWSVRINGNNTTGSSYGLGVYAGTNSSDDSLRVHNYSGTELFKVRGDGISYFSYELNAKTFKLDDTSANGSGRVQFYTGGTRYGYIGTGNWAIGDGTTDLGIVSVTNLKFATGDSTTKMTILTNGNVGINVSPNSILHTSTSVRYGIRSDISLTGINNNFLFLSTNNWNYGVIGGVSADNTSGGDVYGLGYTSSAGSSMTPVLTWKSNGNVGINTNTPSYNLDLYGGNGVRFKASGSYMTVNIDNNNTSGGGGIYFYQNGTIGGGIGSSGWWIGDTSNDLFLVSASSKNIRFCTNDSGTDKMRLTSAGELLIATTSDAGDYKLQVNGAVQASSGFYDTSDIRYKNILNTIKSDNISAIEYTWKDGRNSKKHWGYSAQDVMQILPDAVEGSEDKFYTVNYNEVHTWKIAQLEKEIAYLKSKLK